MTTKSHTSPLSFEAGSVVGKLKSDSGIAVRWVVPSVRVEAGRVTGTAILFRMLEVGVTILEVTVAVIDI